MAMALTAPMTRQIASVTTAASQSGQPWVIRRAKIAAEMPTIEPMERSTTPASSAKPEKAPTISGTMRKVPMIEILPKDTNFGPIQISPTAITAISVKAMLATEPVSACRIGWCGTT